MNSRVSQRRIFSRGTIRCSQPVYPAAPRKARCTSSPSFSAPVRPAEAKATVYQGCAAPLSRAPHNVRVMTDKRSPNDQRSDAKNPTSPEHKAAADSQSNQSNPGSAANQAAADNRSNQMNPNNPASRGGKGRK